MVGFAIRMCVIIIYFFVLISVQFWIMFVWLCSFLDTEQYEEAVRDYEKVYQTEKTSGKMAFCRLYKL